MKKWNAIRITMLSVVIILLIGNLAVFLICDHKNHSPESIASVWSGKTYISHGDSITWQDGKEYARGENIGEVAKGYQTVVSKVLGLDHKKNCGEEGLSVAVVDRKGGVNSVTGITD